MKYQWEQLSPLGKWCVVKSDEPPVIKNGRLRRAEGQGPKVRGVVEIDDGDATNE
jgi:hypothetical protein